MQFIEWRVSDQLSGKKHGELQSLMQKDSYVGEFGDGAEQMISVMKLYIPHLTNMRRHTKVHDYADKLHEINAKEKYFHFLNDETCVQISNLEAEFQKSPKEFSDDDLMRMRDHGAEIQKRVDFIWSKLSDMISKMCRCN